MTAGTCGRMALNFLVESPCSAPDLSSSTTSALSDDIISRPPSVPPHHQTSSFSVPVRAQGIMELAHAAELATAAEAPFSPVSTNSSTSSIDDHILNLHIPSQNSRRPRNPLLHPSPYIPQHLPAVHHRPSPSRTHHCPNCGEVFNQKVRFLHHLYKVHAIPTFDAKPILPCERCDSAFLRNTDRTKHDACVHQKLRPHRCKAPNCVSSFFFAKDLHKHRSTVHLRHKPFPCTICKKAFGKREHMTSHVKRVHQKLRPFKCEVCDIRLASKYNLQGHLKTAAHAAAETVANREALNRANGVGTVNGLRQVV